MIFSTRVFGITSNSKHSKIQILIFFKISLLGYHFFKKSHLKKHWFINKITNVAARNVINNKKRKGTEERKCYYDLISEANDACARASESDVYLQMLEI